MIRFEIIDGGNWRTKIETKPEQVHYVANCTTILARAYAYREERSRAYLIFNDETPVGIVLYHDCDEMDAYIFSELLIDAKHQGKGYGRKATEMILDEMRADGKYKKVVLCYYEGNAVARKLYEKIGFVEVDQDEDEIIMELNFDIIKGGV